MKIATWNVNGVRARESELLAWLDTEKPDVLCLQEIKIAVSQLPLQLGALSGYHSYWHGAGPYSGVSLHLRRAAFPEPPAFSHPAFDHECRVVEARANGSRFVSMYLPNGGKDYPAKIRFLRAVIDYVKEIRGRGEPLVLCGDLNVARDDVDVYVTQRKPTAIGQRREERELFAQILDAGLVDVQRALSPKDDTLFTWWPYWRNLRQKNHGWRIDYVLVSPDWAAKAERCAAQREVGTSDHGPLVAVFR